jgi:hypothetical protein
LEKGEGNAMKAQVAKQLRFVQEWKNVPEGTPVIVTKDDGEQFRTKTRSIPWMLGESSRGPGHTAVIKVDGISGGYLLERVRKA